MRPARTSRSKAHNWRKTSRPFQILFASLLLLLALQTNPPRRAQAADEICFALTLDGPAFCPTEKADKVSVFRPVDLPTRDIETIDYESWQDGEEINTPHVYAWIDDYTPIYSHPADKAAGLPPVRASQPGFTYVSLDGETQYDGETWYLVNTNSPRNREHTDEYIRERNMHFVRPSTFSGVYLESQPPYPFAWVLRNIRPSSLPGEYADPDLPMYYRYDLVTVYGAELVEGRTWYLIENNQWILHGYLGIVDISPRPAGVGANEKWIEVDLYEQTLAAYEGDRLVYATLVSSGLPQWETSRGLFQIWQKVYIAKMSGQAGKEDYYYLEDVPWTMYFNWGTGLHGAYWHDSFGYRHSHGCVNLPPIASQWLFYWTLPYIPEGVNRVTTDGTWVWVH